MCGEYFQYAAVIYPRQGLEQEWLTQSTYLGPIETASRLG
jgi:hypothetical protein